MLDPKGNVECLGDLRGLCALDGRCAACTIRRLREQLKHERRHGRKMQWQNVALRWGLSQLVRRLLDLDDLSLASFAHAVLDTQDYDPKHLQILRGERKWRRARRFRKRWTWRRLGVG